MSELTERLRMEARGHAQEARSANSTIYEIYQIISEKSGEPGNWHGAEPVREYVTRTNTIIEAQADRIDALEAAVSETYRRLMNAQPTIGNASNASFIDNHIDPCMAILKDLLPDPDNGNG